MDYKSSGVDIEAGNETVRRIKELARSTFTAGVLSEIGSFGGLFRIDPTALEGPHPRVECRRRRHQAEGGVPGQRPCDDRGSTSSITASTTSWCRGRGRCSSSTTSRPAGSSRTSRSGSSRASRAACRENGCALLGGETAEMPGFYADGEYDLAGFIVGAVDKETLVDGRSIAIGDVLIGLPSSGLHTNGYSLARRIVFDHLGLGVDAVVEELGGESIGAVLLTPHRSYLQAVFPVVAKGAVKGMAHITGGGITDNIPRVLPEGTAARIDRAAWEVPPLFRWLQRCGDVADEEMVRTFNMGIGMVLVCTPALVDPVLDDLRARHESPVILGDIISGARTVVYEKGVGSI